MNLKNRVRVIWGEKKAGIKFIVKYRTSMSLFQRELVTAVTRGC